jgi:hypothetical protein
MPQDRFCLLLLTNRRVPHISLVFREMWDSTALSPDSAIRPMNEGLGRLTIRQGLILMDAATGAM